MPKKSAAKKTSAKKAKMTKASFVRSLPAGTPAKDVVAKAKAAGISLTEDYVYKTHSLDKAKGKKKSASGKKAAPNASTAAKARGKAPDKKNRVLELKAQNPDWTADQIAKAAKCSTTYVYSVWGGSKGGRGSANGSAKPRSPVMQHLDHVRALRGVILHVGIDQAKAMMDQIVKDLMV
jgi:hypothetical protein